MHDGIHLDRAGIPAATICTDHFVATGQATATVWGVPNYPVIPNLTRVETFGEPFHHWVYAIVDLADPNIFTFQPRIVPANAAHK